eukprot:scaffold85269_cov36-Prasinocladus_malaysianus.AAC.2
MYDCDNCRPVMHNLIGVIFMCSLQANVIESGVICDKSSCPCNQSLPQRPTDTCPTVVIPAAEMYARPTALFATCIFTCSASCSVFTGQYTMDVQPPT